MNLLPSPPHQASPSNPRINSVGSQILRRICFSLFLLTLLLGSYVAGAAVLHFRLPTANFLKNAFAGGVARHERGQPFIPSIPQTDIPLQPGLIVDLPDQTFDGFTLLTTSQFSRALLLDMKGSAVHSWELPFDKVWPKAPHVKNQLSSELIHWFTAHLYPNGDLLAIYQAENDTPSGYGLVKLDKNSRVIWKYAQNAHHCVDVGDDGRIYTITQRISRDKQPGLEQIPSTYIADSLAILSPEGEEQASIPIIQAFLTSPYALLFKSLLTERIQAVESDPFGSMFLTLPGDAKAIGQLPLSSLSPGSVKLGMAIDVIRFDGTIIRDKGDALHVNSAKVLTRSLAQQFPQFKPGQVLVSLRVLDLIAVIDPQTKSVVWATCGAWQTQHDPEFLDNGHLLIYDNFGSRLSTRILEFDPGNQCITWVYPASRADSFIAVHRGMKQRLGNGNTLIVDPEPGRLLEVTADHKIVWQFNPVPENRDFPGKKITITQALTSAHRYRRNALPFLDENIHARPPLSK